MSIISRLWRRILAWDGWYMFPFRVSEPTARPNAPDPAWMAHLQRRVRQRARYLQQRRHARHLQEFLTRHPRTTQPMTTVTACTVCVQDESILNRVL